MLWSDLERMGRFMDPMREFEKMQRALERWSAPSTVEFPAVNVWASAETAVVTSELPGIDPADIDITVTGKTLTFRGSRKADELKEGESYHRRERWYGQFTKTVEMPFEVDAGKVDAKYKQGILVIALPRAQADIPRKISVKSE